MSVAIGIDPGYANCGVAVLARAASWRCVHSVTVKTSPKLPFHERLKEIWRALDHAPFDWTNVSPGCPVIACEEQSGTHEGKRRIGETRAEALRVQQVVGVVRAFAYLTDCRFVEPTPAQAKKVLIGIKNTATKTQVQRAVRAIVSGCPEKMTEHESDAIAIALAGARMVR